MSKKDDLSPPYTEDKAAGPRKGGPTPKQIDVKQIIKLAELGATMSEMGEFFQLNKSSIQRRFGDIIKQAKMRTNMRLRQKQIELALEGDKTMLIWLGKNMLNQSETGARDSDENAPLPWMSEDDEVLASYNDLTDDTTNDEAN